MMWPGKCPRARKTDTRAMSPFSYVAGTGVTWPESDGKKKEVLLPAVTFLLPEQKPPSRVVIPHERVQKAPASSTGCR